MTPDLDALRAAMVDAILDTPMQPVKPTTGQLVDAILAHPKVAALLAEDARTLPLDVEAVIQRIEEEMPGTFVWRQDVVAHLRAAVSGRSASEPLDALLPWIASQYEVHGRTEWHLLNCIYRKTWPMGGEDEPGCIALRAALSTDRSASPTVHCEGDAGDNVCGDIRPHLPHDIFAPPDRSAEG